MIVRKTKERERERNTKKKTKKVKDIKKVRQRKTYRETKRVRGREKERVRGREKERKTKRLRKIVSNETSFPAPFIFQHEVNEWIQTKKRRVFQTKKEITLMERKRLQGMKSGTKIGIGCSNR